MTPTTNRRPARLFGPGSIWWRLLGVALVVRAAVAPVFAQAPDLPPASPQHEHAAPDPAAPALFPMRESSGTAWAPDTTPMFGVQRLAMGWTVMLHGQAFAQFLAESGSEHHGSHQAGSINWGMAMARRPVGAGRLGLRLMMSAEPWTIPGCGYSNLLATGEVCDGDTLHDRQQPHDLLMEVAADYDRPLVGPLRWQIYAGVAGGPALGPAAFPHRLSASPNPIAPIAHHWLDSTHVSFGVVTVGVYGPRWKAEMSAFNGREPDERRANLDLAPLNSIAGRLSYMATGGLALQVSAGHLSEAEGELGTVPRIDVTRATASATHHRALGAAGSWGTTVAYGVNVEEANVRSAADARTHAVLIETSLSLRERHSWFGRFEVVGKPAHDLHAHEFGERVFAVGKLQGGYVRHLAPRGGLVPGIGGTLSASLLPTLLAPRYGGRVAPGAGVFVTIRPARHAM